MDNLKYDAQGLIPAIIQDDKTNKVLMMAYMNKEALEKTINNKTVTFYSRSRKELWTKGETSGNYLYWTDIKQDCDNDTLLIKVNPKGPACHTGNDTCWNEDNSLYDENFLLYLENVIQGRKDESEDKSYTAKLFKKGINKIAQKVGEEAVELVIESKDNDKDLFLGEAADLMYHYIVLLAAKGYCLEDVINTLKGRHK